MRGGWREDGRWGGGAARVGLAGNRTADDRTGRARRMAGGRAAQRHAAGQ
ncbi:hypothetical protein [Actinomadura terrae]|nr:hypothetical protein [Actinomadura terrae]